MYQKLLIVLQTHPTQSCFMSSIDVHTHYSYQVENFFIFRLFNCHPFDVYYLEEESCVHVRVGGAGVRVAGALGIGNFFFFCKITFIMSNSETHHLYLNN